MNDSQKRRVRSVVLIELVCLVIFMVAGAGLVVVTVIAWPWPLIAVVCVAAGRASLEGVFRKDLTQVDEPS